MMEPGWSVVEATTTILNTAPIMIDIAPPQFKQSQHYLYFQ